jgi:hypothetical protein
MLRNAGLGWTETTALAAAGITLAGKRVLDVGPGLGYFVERRSFQSAA